MLKNFAAQPAFARFEKQPRERIIQAFVLRRHVGQPREREKAGGLMIGRGGGKRIADRRFSALNRRNRLASGRQRALGGVIFGGGQFARRRGRAQMFAQQKRLAAVIVALRGHAALVLRRIRGLTALRENLLDRRGDAPPKFALTIGVADAFVGVFPTEFRLRRKRNADNVRHVRRKVGLLIHIGEHR